MMNGRKSAALLFISTLLCAPILDGLEINADRIKVVLHEGVGRFSILLRPNKSGGEYTPLFVNQDPRTSFISLSLDGRVVKLGDSSEFKEKIEQQGNESARFIWQSQKLSATMDFYLFSSGSDGIRDAVKIVFSIQNVSSTSVQVGVRFLLDTCLGEEGSIHFVTHQGQTINREVTFTEQQSLRYWASLYSRKPDEIGLQCITMGGGVTIPNRIVFANWTRLSNAAWQYETSGERNFTQLPYSINDSAVCQYYDPQILPAGEKREIILSLGRYNPSGYILLPGVDEKLGNLLQEVAAPSAAQISNSDSSIRSNLRSVNDLIKEINLKLESGQVISAEEIRLMKQILKELSDKVKKETKAR